MRRSDAYLCGGTGSRVRRVLEPYTAAVERIRLDLSVARYSLRYRSAQQSVLSAGTAVCVAGTTECDNNRPTNQPWRQLRSCAFGMRGMNGK
jgi:hypothetical protein